MTDQGKTRRTILDLLKRDGPQTAGALAAAVELSQMAVRLHLYDLRDQGLIDETAPPRDGGGTATGRPAKLWRLTPAADAFFADGHAELARELIDSMRAAFGDAGLDRIVAVRAGAQITAYGAALGSAADLGRRLTILADLRTEEGYMAHAEPSGDGKSWLLIENHCPICAAARACSGLCKSELQVFRRALGPEVSVERIDHILAGARRCAYRVTPCAEKSA